MRKNNWWLPRSFALSSFLRVSRGRVLLTWIGAIRTLESEHLPGGTKMAQQKSVTLIDDLDGGKAAETITFGLDGASYEIDLSKKNATASARPSPISSSTAGGSRPAPHLRRRSGGQFCGRAPPPRRCGSGRPPRASPSPPAAGSRRTSSHSTRPRRPDPWPGARVREWVRARGRPGCGGPPTSQRKVGRHTPVRGTLKVTAPG